MIIFFSGTGNTAYAAKLLAKELNDDELMPLCADKLLHPENYKVSTKNKKVVWAFPTYSWGIAPVMLNFIRFVNFSEEARSATHYMLTSCGDDMGFTDRQWRKEMAKRRLNAGTACAVQMPNTYVCMSGFDVDSIHVADKKLLSVPFAIRKIADAIRDDGHDILIRKAFSWIKTYIIYPWFVKYGMSPKPFHSTKECIGCRKCSLSCPMDNIEMVNNRPVWSDQCALCLRCYHVCPSHAVAYGNKTAGKGQYKAELFQLKP